MSQAAGVFGRAGLVPGSEGEEAWCSGSTRADLETEFTRVGLALESEIMGLGPSPARLHLGLDSTGGNQIVLTTGMGPVS